LVDKKKEEIIIVMETRIRLKKNNM